jgi:hypothetical protein
MQWILQIALLYGSYLLLIAAHEGGHALAIQKAGYHWQSCQIGPLLLRPGKSAEFSGTFLNGRIEYTAPRNARTFRKDLLVITGGILVNLLLVVLTSILFALLPKQQQAHEWFLPFFSLLSLGMVVGSFLPFSQRYTGLDSDGLQLLRLLSQNRKN